MVRQAKHFPFADLKLQIFPLSRITSTDVRGSRLLSDYTLLGEVAAWVVSHGRLLSSARDMFASRRSTLLFLSLHPLPGHFNQTHNPLGLGIVHIIGLDGIVGCPLVTLVLGLRICEAHAHAVSSERRTKDGEPPLQGLLGVLVPP